MRSRRTPSTVSRPEKSESSNGPSGQLSPVRVAVSMSSTVATPSASSENASRDAAPRMRLTMKPSISRSTTIAVRPMRRDHASARCTVSSDVFGPRTTSQRSITSTGWKKCMLQHSSGRRVASARRETTMLLEFVAMPAPFGRCASRSANTSRLTASSSTTASIAHAQSRAAAARSEPACTRAAAALACSESSLPFSTRRSSHCRLDATACFSLDWSTSCSATSTPCSAACCAICAPMVPAPTTRSRPGASVLDWFSV